MLKKTCQRSGNRLGSAAWALVLLISASAFAAGDDPVQLYRDMRQAVHNSDYEGRFVYQVGERLNAMYVVHRMQGGHELERLVALNGEPKQVIRSARAVACLDPHRRKISVVGSGAAIATLSALDDSRLSALYRFTLGRKVRVAGRPARQLIISPRDDLRYGYRIALDEQTRLPLRSIMLDHQGNVLSQTLFVDLKHGAHVTPIERDLSALQLAERPGADALPVPAPSNDAPANDHWRIAALPTGFQLAGVLTPEKGLRHYLFTDGLTPVSLYLEETPSQPFEGFSRISTVDVYGTQRDGAQVTVVGEVPRKTLQLIANAVVPK